MSQRTPGSQRRPGEEEAPDRVWVSSIEVEGLPGLGGRVRVEMTPRCTVLVGWNGAGKSSLLEGIAAGYGNVAVRAGSPREGRDGRDEVLLRVSRRSPREVASPPHAGERRTRLRGLAVEVIRLHEDEPDAFQDLVVTSRRVGLLRDLRVELYPVPRHGKGEAFPDLAAVQVDGQNLGVLSDGTLRALETLVAVLTPPGTMLLLEEPETGIHPGLLARLLNEVEAYATTGQVLITTHSMQVVSWARPDEIRLVERVDDRTTVRALRPAELARLPDYLAHDGTLGELVFGGGLDA